MLERHAVQVEAFLDDFRDLASKTNLLALDATIEAARAGDARMRRRQWRPSDRVGLFWR
jgi:hypothetical protein